MNFKNIKAVAFDLDGTLVNSIADLTNSANAMRAYLDLPALSQQRLQEHVGDGIASLVHRAITDERDGQAEASLWERGYTFFVQHYHAHLAEHTRAYPGVDDGLSLLRVLKLPLAVITNKSVRLAVPLLEQLGLREQFSIILGGDSLPEKKPSALPLLHTCENFGIKPGELLMVGDSANDIKAARQAGSPVIAVNYGYAPAETLGADQIIGNLAELYDLMKNN
ncbi:MAG TPA: phosphoglycolate phosphatase [Chromobacteriaceae bacterium]|nr:phosphoglycolate phosphatase [Chromobacteriaceae bacterium]